MEPKPYGLIMRRSALKELTALPVRSRLQATIALDRLLAHRNEGGSQPDIAHMRGSADEYRMRVGDYRVVYRKDDGTRTTVVFRIAHRREAYRRR